jgi:hypothetical protein
MLDSGIVSGIIIDKVHIFREPVCNYHFFEKSPAHQQYTVFHPFILEFEFLMKLGKEIYGSLDGTGHKLREK